MKAPTKPRNERYRQAALDGLRLVGTPAEGEFDALVAVGQAVFDVPICLVSLIDNDRQWFKACIGLDVSETGRDISFCGHAILKDEVFVVLDAARDRRFFDNPLVTGGPRIRFYAGAPIRVPSGYRIGTFCIISPEPRAAFDQAQQALLKSLADLTRGVIAVRALRERMDESIAQGLRYRIVLHAAPTPMALVDRAGIVEDANAAFAALCATRPQGRRLVEVLPMAKGAWSPTLMARRGIDDMTVAVKPPVPKQAKAKAGKTGTPAAPPVALRVLRDGAGFLFVAT